MLKIYFDTHAHYEDKRFDKDRDELLANLKNFLIINCGTDLKTSRQSIELAKKYDHIHACIGIHPNNVHEPKLDIFDELRETSRENKIVAIGEIGFDFHL